MIWVNRARVWSVAIMMVYAPKKDGSARRGESSAEKTLTRGFRAFAAVRQAEERLTD